MENTDMNHGITDHRIEISCCALFESYFRISEASEIEYPGYLMCPYSYIAIIMIPVFPTISKLDMLKVLMYVAVDPLIATKTKTNQSACHQSLRLV